MEFWGSAYNAPGSCSHAPLKAHVANPLVLPMILARRRGFSGDSGLFERGLGPPFEERV